MRYLLVILFFASCFTFSKARDLPNIIVFLVDDMGLMDSSVPFITDGKGNPLKQALNDWYHTPGMQRLADQGIRFSNFYSHTVCSPTRASLMTGQNSARHRTTNWIRPDENNKGEYGPDQWNWKGLSDTTVTLPSILQRAGYNTIHIGKAHFGPLNTSGSDPLKLGFDVNIGGGSYGQPGSYYGMDGYGHIKGSRPHAVPHLEKYHGKDIYLTEALTREAKSEIKKSLSEEKPFYLYMSHYAVHAPFQADHRFLVNYSDSDKSAKAIAFATMIEGMDKSLSELMDLLNDLGIAENTLIFFLGDNGSDAPLGNQNEIACSAPLRGKKGSKWEGGTRVPFIAAWAKHNADNIWQKKIRIKQGGIQEQPGYCYDIFPTILELLDTPIPENHSIDGRDLSKLLSGRKDKNRTGKFLSHFPHWHRSNMFTTYRSGDWKIIYHYFPEAENTSSRYLLYNLKDDPSESHDLAEENPKRVRTLMLEMLHELESKSALFPVKDGVSVRPVVPEE